MWVNVLGMGQLRATHRVAPTILILFYSLFECQGRTISMPMTLHQGWVASLAGGFVVGSSWRST